ncbi:MAG: serine/threonine protein kinase [Deltaproteobacteria bacterium]|nr:serine/threonine protein kinase [Deltaproteobacteria bacterium]
MNVDNFRPGELIDGRWILERALGRGASAVVWAASDARSTQKVALKIFYQSFARHPAARALVDREAHILMKLDHPGIAKLLAARIESDLTYLVLELVDGEPLDRILVRTSREGAVTDMAVLARVFGSICEAVGYAHSLGVVHRDLKPQNIMVLLRGRAWYTKVLDFGIARWLETPAADATTLGRPKGSPFYMPPEQARGESTEARSDVFALGALLFELATCRRAWAVAGPQTHPPCHVPVPQDESNSFARVASRVLEGPRPRARSFRPELSATFDTIISQATSVDPDRRFQDADELGRAVEKCLRSTEQGSEEVTTESRTSSAAVPEPHTPRRVPRAPRILAPLSAFGLGVVLGLGATRALVGAPFQTPPGTESGSIGRPVSNEELDRILEAVADARLSDPPERVALERIAADIVRAAERHPNAATRTKISRVARGSVQLGNLDGLAACARMIRQE